MDGLTDSFDLVPIAAWYGKGKRTGVYGAYLLACYDPEEEVYQAITKVGTGFSEEMLTQLTEVRASIESCYCCNEAPLFHAHSCARTGVQLKGVCAPDEA